MKVHLNIAKKRDKSISKVLDKLFHDNKKLQSGYINKKIKLIWAEEMGPTINSYTKSIYVNKKTLFISLNSSALRHELSMSKQKLILLINKKLGIDLIEDTVIR